MTAVDSEQKAPGPAVRFVLEPVDEAWLAISRRRVARARVSHFVRALRTPAVAIPAAVLVLIVLACFAGPAIFGLPGPNAGNITDYLKPVGSPGHLFGTNALGNDMLSRVLYGGQVSIVVGIGATAIGAAIGTALGMAAGYYAGAVEATVMRILDTLLAFPGLILALAIAEFLGPSEINTILAISVFGVASYGRLARSQTLGVRHRDYVTAARADGAGAGRIIFGHIFPNVIPPLLAYAMTSIGMAMLIEAGLSFVGLGIRPPQPSWGNLIASGESNIQVDPSLVLIPSIALFITVLSLNVLADALQKRLREDR